MSIAELYKDDISRIIPLKDEISYLQNIIRLEKIKLNTLEKSPVAHRWQISESKKKIYKLTGAIVKLEIRINNLLEAGY